MNHPTIDAVQAKRVARAEFVTRLFIVLLIALLVASLSTIVVLLGQVRSTQLDGTPLGKQIASSSQRILDCTEAGSSSRPAGECYVRNQTQMARVLRQVLGGNIAAAVCALKVPANVPLQDAIAQVTECVLTQRKP